MENYKRNTLSLKWSHSAPQTYAFYLYLDLKKGVFPHK